MRKHFITDEERIGSEAFNKLVEEDFRKEMLKPASITVYLPSAQFDMEAMLAPSDDTNHPNYRSKY